MSGLLATAPSCPNCDKLLDAFTALESQHTPQAGDISLCFYCAEPLVFAEGPEGLTIEQPSLELLGEMFKDPLFAKSYALLKARRGGKL